VTSHHHDDDLDFAASPVARAPLSDAGERRRAEMLRLLSGAVVARRRRRTATRLAAAAVVGVAAAFAAFRALRGPDPLDVSPSSVARTSGEPPPLPVLAHARVESVPTDPRVLDTTLVATDAGIAARASVDDAALLEILAAAGRETGLVRFGDRVFLTEPADDEAEEVAPADESRGA